MNGDRLLASLTSSHFNSPTKRGDWIGLRSLIFVVALRANIDICCKRRCGKQKQNKQWRKGKPKWKSTSFRCDCFLHRIEFVKSFVLKVRCRPISKFGARPFWDAIAFFLSSKLIEKRFAYIQGSVFVNHHRPNFVPPHIIGRPHFRYDLGVLC